MAIFITIHAADSFHILTKYWSRTETLTLSYSRKLLFELQFGAQQLVVARTTQEQRKSPVLEVNLGEFNGLLNDVFYSFLFSVASYCARHFHLCSVFNSTRLNSVKLVFCSFLCFLWVISKFLFASRLNKTKIEIRASWKRRAHLVGHTSTSKICIEICERRRKRSK